MKKLFLNSSAIHSFLYFTNRNIYFAPEKVKINLDYLPTNISYLFRNLIQGKQVLNRNVRDTY